MIEEKLTSIFYLTLNTYIIVCMHNYKYSIIVCIRNYNYSNKFMFAQVKMTQKSIKIFTNESFFEPPKKIYPTNKTDFYHFDDIWSLDISDWKDYGPENNRGYRYVLVVTENFSKKGWTIPLKNESTQTKTDSFQNVITTSKRKPILIGTDRGKIFFQQYFPKVPK